MCRPEPVPPGLSIDGSRQRQFPNGSIERRIAHTHRPADLEFYEIRFIPGKFSTKVRPISLGISLFLPGLM